MNHDTPTQHVPPVEGILKSPSDWALFLDIDGTLLDMAAAPDAVVVPPELLRVLSGLVKTFGGAVALSTGRSVKDADRLFAPLQLPTCGVHGTEARLVPGGDVVTLVASPPERLLEEVTRIASVNPGVLVEPKGVGIAVHYRNAPEARPQLERDLKRLLADAQFEAYRLYPGRMILEVLPHGYSKGTALNWLMTLAPFKGRRPIMIGDDAGDESAIAAAERHGGIGLKVTGEHFSASQGDFDSIPQVRLWLAALAEPLVSATGS